MTVSSVSNRITYTGNGVTTAFSFPYEFGASSDLKVYKGGVLQTITTHYTVSGGSGSSGTVTFLAAPASSVSVVIYDDPPATQTLDYIANDPFPAESHESGLDKLTRLVRRLKDRLDRAVRLADTDVSGASVELPAVEAGSVIGWNGDGTALVNIEPEDLGTAALSIGNYAVDHYDAVTHFTAGTTTSLTMGGPPGSKNNTQVTFDGVLQHKDTYSVAGSVITFTSAIPVGTLDVEIVRGGALSIGTPSDGTVSTAKINDNAVTTAKINDDAVTLAKIQDVSTSIILGRSSGGSGDVEQLTAAQVRTLLGLAAIATSGSASDLTTGDVAQARLATALNASGSAPLYAARAWVNFNGTGTVAIRASGNVSSITDNGVGDYTLNFTTALPDANYAIIATVGAVLSGNALVGAYESNSTARGTSAVRIYCGNNAGGIDMSHVSATIIR